ncbi:MAG: ABC transporter ATP-binding protein [Oscillospiraceae bacterium]|nr:ABC transporter ATP-binding protein [Oscillospiraceae bacterium]
MAMLEINGLNCFYGNVQVLWDVSMNIEQAEIVALLGANGAGKTTLLNSITGLVAPRSGSIIFEGAELMGAASHTLLEKGISYLPENGGLFPDMSVRENLEMGAYPRSVWKDRKAKLEKVFEMFPKLKEREKQMARTLSGGERQMLAMGRSMMTDVKLCLFDELSYGLSPLMAKEAFKIVQKMRDSGITVMLVEQNVKQSMEIADRAYVMENGRIVLSGKCSELMEDDYIKRAYLGL